MNRIKLVGIMRSYGDHQQDLAEYLGISQTRLSAKLRNRGGADFTRPEISKIIRRYSMTADEIIDIFFDDVVH